jgi:hypothetical protein
VVEILFISLLEVFLELKDVALGDLGEVALILIKLKVLSVGHLDKVDPGLREHIDLLLDVRLNDVVVHFEYAELFDDLIDSELHVHAGVLDLADDVEHVLEPVDAVHLSLHVLLVLADVIHDVLQLLLRDFDQGLAQDIEPLVDLLKSLRLDLLVVDEDEEVVVHVWHLMDLLVVALETQDRFLDLEGLLVLEQHLLQLSELILVEEFLEIELLDPTTREVGEFVDDLVAHLADLVMQVSDHGVEHHIIVESVRDVLL